MISSASAGASRTSFVLVCSISRLVACSVKFSRERSNASLLIQVQFKSYHLLKLQKELNMGFFSERKRGRSEVNIKNKSLDREASAPRVKIRHDSATDFDCFRCNTPKKAKLMYEWSTSEGKKVVCNGCHGFLCSLSKNNSKVTKKGNVNKRVKRSD